MRSIHLSRRTSTELTPNYFTGEAGTEPTSDKASNQDEWGEFVSCESRGREWLPELTKPFLYSFTALERSSSISTRFAMRLLPTLS